MSAKQLQRLAELWAETAAPGQKEMLGLLKGAVKPA